MPPASLGGATMAVQTRVGAGVTAAADTAPASTSVPSVGQWNLRTPCAVSCANSSGVRISGFECAAGMPGQGLNRYDNATLENDNAILENDNATLENDNAFLTSSCTI